MEAIELVRVFRAARELIASPERWLASGYAADELGRFTPIGSPYAARFSTTGALLRACRGSRELYRAARRVLDGNLAEPAAGEALTHAECLALLERAITEVGGRAEYVPKQSGFVRRDSTVDGATAPLPATRGRSR